MNRREFVQGAAVLTAGAAVGLPVRQGWKEAPAELKMFFLTDDPIKTPATIFSDEENGIFGIRSGERGAVCGQMALEWIKSVVASSPRKSTSTVIVRCPDEMVTISTDAAVQDGKLMFWEHGKEGSPFWIDLPQVQLVL